MVLHQLSALYRALVWEGFILLAVAAGESPAEPGSVAPPPSPTVAMAAGESPAESGSVALPSSPTVAMELGAEVKGSEVPSVVIAPPSNTSLETAESASNQPATQPSHGEAPKPDHAPSEQPPQHPSILVESLKQLTPLLTITSRVGRSLAELMSLLIRLSTSPLHRTHRRGVGHILMVHSYQEPAKEAIDVCMEVSNLLLDSLRWEVPMPQACSSAMHSPIRDWLFAG